MLVNQNRGRVPRILVKLHPATVLEESLEEIVTTLSELQRIIIRKLGLDSRKRVRIYYRIPISIVAQGVKYGCLAIEGDDDLQIVFHCRRQFPEVEEALRADGSDVEPEFIEEDSDDETGPAPPPQRDTSSSGTQQYPRHLSNLNLDALSGPGRGASGSSSGAQ
ncbi:hypothetical protein PIB30_087409, partial [Stylosanthes scabra]|nr:hypothetical protein [Stylosanthes scabra]